MMFRTLAACVVAICAGLLLCAQSPNPSFPPGVFLSRGAIDASSGGGGYTGPIDVNGTAYAFWSTRCGSTSYTGDVVDIWDGATGSTTETLVTCSSGGILNTGSPSALATTCAVSCKAKTLYDQSGSNKCAGATACNVTQATNADRPAITTSCQNGKICLACDGSVTFLVSSTAYATSTNQPLTTEWVADRTTVAAFAGVYEDANALGYSSSVNTLASYFGGSFINATATDNALHAIQILANNGGNAWSYYVDGSATSGSAPGSQASSGTPSICGKSGGDFLAAKVFEVGIWAADKSANYSTMNSNIHTYWNF